MKDPWNPTPEEIRHWAYTPGAMCEQDWDLCIASDRQYVQLYVDLASDPCCPNRDVFLNVLYMMVGQCFRGSSTHPRYVELWSHEYSTHSDPAIRTWAERTAILLANPGRFDYEFWFDRGHKQPLAGEAETKEIDTIDDFTLTFYSIDREGYIALYADLEEVEQSLEWIDVENGEYIVIDDIGHLYEPIKSSDRNYEHKWQRTLKQYTNHLKIIQHYNDDDQMVVKDLVRFRSDFILPRTKPWWKFW